MDLDKIYSIIGENYPTELYPSAEPYRLGEWKIKAVLNTFIDKVNGIFKTRGMEVVIIALDRIIVDNRFQSRVEMNGETILRYKDSYNNGAKMPPIDIGTIREYKGGAASAPASTDTMYYLLDGFHRYAAKKEMPIWNHFILAAVRYDIPEADAKTLSIINNRKQGLGYTKQDKAKILDIYIETKKYLKLDGSIKSFRHIARELQIISEPTIRRRITKYYPDIAEQIKAAYFGTTADTEQEDEAAEAVEADNEAEETKRGASKAEKALNRALSTLSKRAEVIADRNAAMRYERSLLALLNASRKKWGRAEIESAEDYEEDF